MDYENKNKKKYMGNFKQKAIMKAFSALPLWGKIALPAVLFIFLAVVYTMFSKAISLIFWVAILGLLALVVSKAFNKFKNSDD